MSFFAASNEDPFNSKEEVLMEQALGVPLDHDEEEDPEEEKDEMKGFSDVSDGFQFLKRAKQEARKCQTVAVAQNVEEIRQKSSKKEPQGHYVDRQKGGLKARFVPSGHWQAEQVQRFSDLRTKLERNQIWLERNPQEVKKIKFPARDDEKGWCLFCYGSQIWERIEKCRVASEEEEEEKELEKSKNKKKKKVEFVPETDEGSPPLISIIHQLKPNVVAKIFEFHVEWCEALEQVLSQFGVWIYALMARLEKPLYPDIISSMRSLALVCSKQRERVTSEFKEDEELKIVNSLTLIICLVSKYFNQSDLAD